MWLELYGIKPYYNIVYPPYYVTAAVKPGNVAYLAEVYLAFGVVSNKLDLAIPGGPIKQRWTGYD